MVDASYAHRRAMKILFLISSLALGGAERQLIELAKGLRQRGHRVAIAVSYAGYPLEAGLQQEGVELFDLNKRGRWDLAGYLTRLLAIVREYRPDVLHSYLTVPNLVAALFSRAYESTAVVWGVRASDMRMEHYDWLARLTERSISLLASRTDGIIINSQAGFRHHLRLGFPESKMQVIDNGIDTDRFRRDTSGGVALRTHWGVQPGQRLVGLVGRLDPMKGHSVFLEAAAKIAARNTSLRFVCAGSGRTELSARLRAQANELGLQDRIIWQEAVSNPVSIYSALDGLCSASIFGEGFSNVIAEAMSCGTPCAVTDVGDSARIVGELGYIAQPGDVVSLQKALAALLEDLKSGQVDRQALRNRIVDEFSLGKLVDRTEIALRQIIAGKAAPGSRAG